MVYAVTGGVPQIHNTGNASIDTLSINRGYVLNQAAIGDATVQISGLLLNDYGSIDTVSIMKNGRVDNGTNASISKVSIIDNGLLGNGYFNPNAPLPMPRSNASIDTVSVAGNGRVINHNLAVIDNVSVSGDGIVENFEGASVNSMSITGNGSVDNRMAAYIGKISVDGNGSLSNVINSAGIGEANVTGWGTVNNNDIGRIEAVSVAGNGWINNNGNASIGRAHISDWGRVANNGGIVESAVVEGGFLDNNGFVQNLQQNAGTVNNVSMIENMTNTAGTFNGQTGTIGTLQVAGNFEAGENWGTIQNLVFADDGSGILSIKAFAEESAAGLRTTRDAAPTASEISFASVGAENIDLTHGSVVFDLSDFNGDESALMNEFEGGFSMASLLGASEESVTGVLISFTVTPGEGAAMGAEMINLISAGLAASGMSLSAPTAGGEYVWTAGEASGNPTPEPATLLMLGVGLAGLGLARRRRR